MAAQPPRADFLIITAGSIAFAANFRDAKGFPDNGYETIAATITLAVIMATVKNSSIAPAANAFAGLALLVAIFYYVPGFTKNRSKKGKRNG